MSAPVVFWAAPCAAVLCLLAAACASAPEPRPLGPLNEPVDAFEAVGEPLPRGGPGTRDQQTLSSDIERLKNARQTYRQARERQQAEALRRQAECRASPDSKQVPIRDGSDDPDAVYCQSADRTGAQ